MSLQLMKERINSRGNTPREEMIRDGQNLLKEELEHDSSYSPTMYFCKYEKDICNDDRLGNIRIYGRKYSSLNGNYQEFLTTYDNPVKIGDYFHDTKDNTYWLVSESFNENDIQYRGKMIQCNYQLRWQLSNGDIVSRWANIVSASKYDVGENGNSTIFLTSNNYTILIGFCEEGFELEEKRVFIDRKTVPTKVFKITRYDDPLYDAGAVVGSLMSFVTDKTELDISRDNQELRICDYNSSITPTPITPPSTKDEIVVSISGGDTLRIGRKKSWKVDFTDKDGNTISYTTFSWNVKSNFNVTKTVTDNTIQLFVDDDSLIDESFLLQILNDNGDVIGEKEISIVEGF